MTEHMGEIKVKTVKVKNDGTNEIVLDICGDINIGKENNYKILFQV